MKMKKELWIKTVLTIALSLCVLSSGMLLIFASGMNEDQSVDDAQRTPDVDTAADDAAAADGAVVSEDEATQDEATQDEATQDDAAAEAPLTVHDATIPLTQEQLAEKFGGYTHFSEENGKLVATIYTAQQIEEIRARRASGEVLKLTSQEMLYLLNDTKHLFEMCDIIRITDLDGIVHEYRGTRFYSSADYGTYFTGSMTAEQSAASPSFDLKDDAYETMLFRIEALHSYAEHVCYREGMEDMWCFTDWKADAELYQSVCHVAKNYADGYTGSPEEAAHRLAFVRGAVGSMLYFTYEGIYYVEDLKTFDTGSMVQLYPGALTPGGAALDRYDNGSGKSVVIEVWSDATDSRVARIRLDEANDAEAVAKISSMWESMNSMPQEKWYRFSFNEESYRIAVYLNGFGYEDGENCFLYISNDPDPDCWSEILWDLPLLEHNVTWHGGSEMRAYIDAILADRLGAN